MSRQWLRAAGIRAVKTMAETAIATLGSTALITEVNWGVVLSATLMSGLLTVLFALKGLPEVTE